MKVINKIFLVPFGTPKFILVVSFNPLYLQYEKDIKIFKNCSKCF